MNHIEQVDTLIIGSGPAGVSTALHLVKTDPNWAKRVVVVDQAIHPRDKLCGGGITRLGDDVLAKLELRVSVPYIPIREAQIVYQRQRYTFRGDPVFRVVRRAEFDHWLVRQAEMRGILIRQGEAAKDIIPGSDGIFVITERSTIRAKVVVAADGSRSLVRRKLKWGNSQRIAGLLEVLTSEVAEKQVEFKDNVAVFDFSPMDTGLQGYYWDFPSLVKGEPFMNHGIFDSRIRPERPRVRLKHLLSRSLERRGRKLDDYKLNGHPLVWFNPQDQFSRPHLILAGDAAGVDPLVGEGISFALAYGEVASAAIVAAFAVEDFSFADYAQRILEHPTVGQLRLRARLARISYALRQPWLIGFCWRLAPLVIRAIAWYNPHAVTLNDTRLIRLR